MNLVPAHQRHPTSTSSCQSMSRSALPTNITYPGIFGQQTETQKLNLLDSSVHQQSRHSPSDDITATTTKTSQTKNLSTAGDLSSVHKEASRLPLVHNSTSERKNSLNTMRRRTSRACDQCNHLRTKCDGHHPCNRCIENKQSCEYARLRKKRGKVPKKALSQKSPLENRVTSSTSSSSSSSTVIHDNSTRWKISNRREQQNISVDLVKNQSASHFRYPVPSQTSLQLPQPDNQVVDERSTGSPGTSNMSVMSDPGGSAPSTRMILDNGANPNKPIDPNFQSIIMEDFGDLNTGDGMNLNTTGGMSNVYNIQIDGLQGDNFLLDSFNYSNDNRSAAAVPPLLEGSVESFSPENPGGMAYQIGAGTSTTIKYPVLNPVLPYIKQILPNSLACELLEHYFASSSSAIPHPVSPYLPGFIFSKQSFLTSMQPRKCTPALLASILWIAARTSDARSLTSPTSTRGRICQRLLNLTVTLLQPLVHGSTGGTTVSEYPGKLIINGSALGGDGITLDNLTSDKITADTVDDIVTYMHIGIVVSASEDKAASIRWWNMAWSLAKELKLGQELPVSDASDTSINYHHDGLLIDNDDNLMTHGSLSISITEEAREERRRIWWELYCMDRHLALCYNRPLILLERECEGLKRPMNESNWQSGNFPINSSLISTSHPHQHQQQQQQQPTSTSRFDFTGPSVFGWFLPLMTILGEIIDLHHARENPLFKSLPREMQYWDNQIQKLIVEQLEVFERSMNTYQVQYIPIKTTPAATATTAFNENEPTRRNTNSSMTELQIHTKIAIAYSSHIMHVLHILLTGKLDPISLLNDEDLWISSTSFVTAIGHAVSGAQVVTDILTFDPDLSFIPFFYGIYLLQGSFLLLLVADKLQGDANPSVVRACETMIRAHEACVVTLNTEYQKAFRKVMQSALAQVRGRTPEDPVEQHRRRRETLALYRWTGDGTGLAI